MRTEDIENAPPSPWIPETDPVRCAILSKSQEEHSELGIELARCQAQGINEINPTTGRLNYEGLADELDDMETMIRIIREEFKILPSHERQEKKYNYQQRWYADLRALATSEEDSRALDERAEQEEADHRRAMAAAEE